MTFLKSEVLVIVKSFSLDGRQDKKGRELCLSRLNCCVWAYLGTNVASAPSKVNFEHLEDGHCNFLNHFTDFTTSFCKLASTTKNGKLFLFLCFEETEENGQQECPKKGRKQGGKQAVSTAATKTAPLTLPPFLSRFWVVSRYMHKAGSNNIRHPKYLLVLKLLETSLNVLEHSNIF